MNHIELTSQFIVVDKKGNAYKMFEFTYTEDFLEEDFQKEQITYFLENGLEVERINRSEFRVKQTGKHLRKSS